MFYFVWYPRCTFTLNSHSFLFQVSNLNIETPANGNVKNEEEQPDTPRWVILPLFLLFVMELTQRQKLKNDFFFLSIRKQLHWVCNAIYANQSFDCFFFFFNCFVFVYLLWPPNIQIEFLEKRSKKSLYTRWVEHSLFVYNSLLLAFNKPPI